jgi:nucleotide-binding universal stress UspA family protein
MLKRILLPLDPTSYTDCALKFAISLAKANDAEITGLVILDQEGIEAATGPLPPGVSFYAKELQNTKVDLAKVHIQNLLSKFKSRCEDAGVKHYESNAQGSPRQRICEFANFYDLLITGINNQFHFETSNEFINTIDDTLENIVTPVIAVPDDYEKINSNTEQMNIVIAVNDSINSIRAFQNFLDIILPKKCNCTVFVSDDDIQKAEAIYLNAKDYLRAHGFENIHKYITKKDKISVFNQEYLTQIDMIVLGTHSKKGIFDFLIGSLTKHLINENQTALLVSQ